jgi:Rrf2 family protein
LIYLAEKDAPGPVLVREIAEAAEVPHPSLAKILHSLRGRGLVRSTKGPGGGYQLARPGDQMRVIEVIEAVDGRVDLDTVCILGLDTCSDEASCALHDVWKLFRQNYATTLTNMTLRDAANVLKAKRSARGVPEARVAAVTSGL